MGANDFRYITTFKQLQEVRTSLEYRIERSKGKLWIPFALTVIRTLKSKLSDK